MHAFWTKGWDQHLKLVLSGNQGLVRCENQWRWDVRQFMDWDLWIALDGRGSLVIENKHHTVEKGFSVCFSPGPWRVQAEHDPRHPLQVFYCHFSLAGSNLKALPEAPAPEPFYLEVDPLLWGTVRELSGYRKTPAANSFHENLLWQLLLRERRSAPAHSSTAEDRVRELTRRLREDASGIREITQLAQEAGMSPGHLRRVFKKVTGQTPVQFLIHCRIERARYYLRESTLGIEQIANTVGYRDVYFFSRQFKEITGKSPTAWRKTGKR